MPSNIKIELIDANNSLSIIPLLAILNPTIPIEALQSRLSEMITQGYKCVGAFDGEKLIGICGLWIMTKFYVGKHIEPDNVIILPEYRSKGVGKELMLWVYDYGKSQGCIASELNCYLSNTKGQEFWEAEGFKAIGYHYQKKF